MRITVLGAGNVGCALGRHWQQLGHDVTYGVRDPDVDRYAGLSAVTTPDQALPGAELVAFAVPWDAVLGLARTLHVGDAVVIDATNPIARGPRPELAGTSGAALLAAALGSARVVKAFNTTGAENMADAGYGAQRPAMFLAGDDAEAKAIVSGLAGGMGFEPVDAGGLGMAVALEHLATLWVGLAYGQGNGRDIAFALLRR